LKNPWDHRYSSEDYYYGTLPNSFLKENLKYLTRPSRVLCIGDGEGRNSVFLAQNGHLVTALDLSQVGLNKMQKLADFNKVRVQPLLADLNDYQFQSESWDAIVSIWCHIPSSLRSRVHQGVRKALKPNGLFIFEAYRPEQLTYKTGGPSDIDFLVTINELKNDFKDFEILVAAELIRDVQEGLGHSGPSAVVHFIARKVS